MWLWVTVILVGKLSQTASSWDQLQSCLVPKDIAASAKWWCGLHDCYCYWFGNVPGTSSGYCKFGAEISVLDLQFSLVFFPCKLLH
jgi:hypothetical protein